VDGDGGVLGDALGGGCFGLVLAHRGNHKSKPGETPELVRRHADKRKAQRARAKARLDAEQAESAVKEEAKEQAKEEAKEQAKDEAKEQANDEAKEQAKDETKEQAKDETKEQAKYEAQGTSASSSSTSAMVVPKPKWMPRRTVCVVGAYKK